MVSAACHAALIALLLFSAGADVRRRRVPNLLVVAVFVVGVSVSILDPAAPAILSSLGAFALTLIVGVTAWRCGLFGGADAKLAAAAAAWVGLSRLPQFAGATAVVGGMLAIACYGWSAAEARAQMRANLSAAALLGPAALNGARKPGRVSVPYGVAIATGALYAVLRTPP